ncbi:MAG: SRPBCC family protein [Gemmatimonadales bacterium]
MITREFEAPPHLVYRAWTSPDLVRRWWAGQRGRVTSAEIDLRVGGRWRFVMVTPKDFEVAFHGEYRELVPGERIVSTEVYEAVPDAPALNTLVLTDLGGRTRLVIISRHTSPAHRDAVIASGMEGGMQEALDLLEQTAIALG